MDAIAISHFAALMGAPTESATPARPVTPDQRVQIQAVKAAVETVNESGQLGSGNQLSIFVDRKTNQAVVRVVNRQSGDVVLQIPNEQVLRMAEGMAEESHGG